MTSPPLRRVALVAALLFSVSGAAFATLVPRMSFEQIVEGSVSIVHGTVVRTWSAWDSSRSTIWTHYEVRIVESLKGDRVETIVVSEPGGEVDGIQMQVVGAPRYVIGEEVVLFAASTPMGYLRTCGWGQGKFQVREVEPGGGKRILGGLGSVQLVDPTGTTKESRRAAGVDLKTLDGLSLEDFKARVRAGVSALGRVETSR